MLPTVWMLDFSSEQPDCAAIVGPGSNRMNRGMVQQTALGIAHYVNTKYA